MFPSPRILRTVMGMSLLLLGSAGCELAVDLDPKTEPTIWYVAGFQGLDYRSREDLARLRNALAATQQAHDLNATSRAMSELGSKYTSVAEQVHRLDKKHVDADAVAYVDRFASLYRQLGELHQRCAKAISEGNTSELLDVQPQFEAMKQQTELMQSDREVLFQTLSNRYGGKDFNTVDY